MEMQPRELRSRLRKRRRRGESAYIAVHRPNRPLEPAASCAWAWHGLCEVFALLRGRRCWLRCKAVADNKTKSLCSKNCCRRFPPRLDLACEASIGFSQGCQDQIDLISAAVV